MDKKMKVIKLSDNLYKKLEKASKMHGMEVNDLVTKAIKEGVELLNEKNILELYRNRKITLQKAAEMLSLDIWNIIDKLKKADIHIDYTIENLIEDTK
ncbi:MAG: UPF0175 family protein [Candidatus Loosdrechtia sp.]|uniref:UPF0175 family protein n=1 Tax=Candidatus Loosdrechtia sp. TaxID=3101272 RepID=UPI003A6635C2|nr:MAG: UPF0175 family protein [Candidatus Jettenia sp. AMX2]